MMFNKRTLALAAAGVVSLGSVAQAEEKLNSLQTMVSSTTLSGYVDTSIHWNLGSGNAFSPAYSFSGGKSDGFNLNVVKVRLEKPLDESQWAAGYVIDMIMGPDAVGFNDAANSFAGVDDFGLKEAYVALRAPVGNGIDFKIGTWNTIIGYEVFESGSNPNYTRSYGYSIEPTQHTGVLASYQLNKVVGFSVGIANTLTAGINARAINDSGNVSESRKTYMGAVTITAPEDSGFLAGSALYAGIIDGFAGSGDEQTSYYIGATLGTPVAGMKIGASLDVVDDLHIGGVNVGSAWAAAIYSSFQLSEKAGIHARAEYARNSGGIWNTGGGVKDVFALTGTLQYDLWKNVISRLEVRWDHAMDSRRSFDPLDAFGSGGKRNEFLVAANFIYKF